MLRGSAIVLPGLGDAVAFFLPGLRRHGTGRCRPKGSTRRNRGQ
jgi:hypothetical protein